MQDSKQSKSLLSLLFLVSLTTVGARLPVAVFNPRTEPDEDPAEIVRRVTGLTELLGKDRIWLNPDCGLSRSSPAPRVATTRDVPGPPRYFFLPPRSSSSASLPAP